MSEKAKGKMKEAAGAITGEEAKKAEGRAEQSKAEAAEEAKQRENRARQRPRLRRKRGSSTGSGARTRVASWATCRPTRRSQEGPGSYGISACIMLISWAAP